MKTEILVLSDSHGISPALRSVLAMHRGIDYIFFLGDGLGDIDRCGIADNTALVTVKGNCDFGLPGENEALLPVGGVKFLLCHGHRNHVKYMYADYVKYAASKGADVALFGHTHVPYLEYLGEGKPSYLFNPGSIGAPDGGKPSFGLISIDGDKLLFSHGNV